MLRTAIRTTSVRRAVPAPPSCPGCAAAAFRHLPSPRLFASTSAARAPILDQTPDPAVNPVPIAPAQQKQASAPDAEAKPKPRTRTAARPRKAALTLSKGAVERIQNLLDQPEPKLIRVGVRNKGCAGMSYHLEYVDKPEKFDEVVEQDGVKVVIDSKALFSIIGSQMDWQEDALQARFVFNNPNIKDACGCGESFIV
ncbi:Iron-sulfur assembly protein 1 [Rhodotorula sphaerocarpa]